MTCVRIVLLISALCFPVVATASLPLPVTGSEQADPPATAGWITHPEAVLADQDRTPIALQFRRDIQLDTRPPRLRIRVSADNRFVLYVNGRRVAAGPARGDLDHWRYEQVDIAPFLHEGRNVIAAHVWNDGQFAPRVQASSRTGFYIAAEEPDHEQLIGTRSAWQVRVDRSRMVASGMAQFVEQMGGAYYAAGGPETIDAAQQRPDWLAPNSTAGDWAAATTVPDGTWQLEADRLPQMSFLAAPGGRVVRARGIAADGFPARPLTIPANSEASLLLDAGAVQAAYPELVASGGAGARITVTYTEALYDRDKQRLRDRAAVGDGLALGLQDTFLPSGGGADLFQPFWWRVWRFAEIRVKTGSQPVTLTRFARHTTGYPFETKAWFRSSDPELDRIWQIGWDTLRLDAHETFMDTAYWEQLQYAGDSRIEALVADTVSGDTRLTEQMLRAFDQSRIARGARASMIGKPDPEIAGLPQAAYPSSDYQSIPPFGLLWIGSLADYRLRAPATETVRESLNGVRFVLDWYAAKVGADGLVGKAGGWTFIDWRPNLEGNPVGPTSNDANLCVVSLLYLGALKEAAGLEAELGDVAIGQRDEERAETLAQAIRKKCWSSERQLFADNPEHRNFSQHANILAVLYDVAPKAEQVALLDRVTVRDGGIAAPSGITATTYYFSFYLARALAHAGLTERYPEMLRSWRELLAQNFTTWPENPDPTRSDSHAWSAHPTAHLLSLVAGIQPATAGFATVRVVPHLGALTSLDAAMPHHKGMIRVRYRRSGSSLGAVVTLPPDTRGQFEWAGSSRPLDPGENRFTIP